MCNKEIHQHLSTALSQLQYIIEEEGIRLRKQDPDWIDEEHQLTLPRDEVINAIQLLKEGSCGCNTH